MSVARDSVNLRDDASIDSLQPGDQLEFVPIIEEGGRERTSWVTSDATPADLGPAEGKWDGQVATAIVTQRRESGSDSWLLGGQLVNIHHKIPKQNNVTSEHEP